VAWRVTPKVERIETGNGQNVLQLTTVIIGNTTRLGNSSIVGISAFDFNDRIMAGGEAIETRVQPSVSSALKASSHYFSARSGGVAPASFRFKLNTNSHSLILTKVARWAALFLQ
jgi:hypothetical protein